MNETSNGMFSKLTDTERQRIIDEYNGKTTDEAEVKPLYFNRAQRRYLSKLARRNKKKSIHIQPRESADVEDFFGSSDS